MRCASDDASTRTAYAPRLAAAIGTTRKPPSDWAYTNVNYCRCEPRIGKACASHASLYAYIDKVNPWLSNCDQTANAATATCRPPRPLPGFARTSARSALIAWTTCSRTFAPTAEVASRHDPFARRRNGVPGYRSRSVRRRTSAARCRTAAKRSRLTVSGSGTFHRRGDRPPRLFT
jgi:hypothetical protein